MKRKITYFFAICQTFLWASDITSSLFLTFS